MDVYVDKQGNEIRLTVRRRSRKGKMVKVGAVKLPYTDKQDGKQKMREFLLKHGAEETKEELLQKQGEI